MTQDKSAVTEPTETHDPPSALANLTVVHTSSVSTQTANLTAPIPPTSAAGPIDPISIVVGTIAGVINAVLSPFAVGGPAAPADPPTLWTLLAWVRRELFNESPQVDQPVQTITSSTGLVTGSIGASDPDGDALTYTVISEPRLGKVTIDQATGTFTYTPVVDMALVGGADTFKVLVSDDTNLHLHGPLGILSAAVQIFERIPFVGSLVSSTLRPLGLWPEGPHATVKEFHISVPGTDPNAVLTFPDGFHWGVASAGFQYEMGNPDANNPDAVGDMVLDQKTDWWQWTHDAYNEFFGLFTGGIGKPENGAGGYVMYDKDAQLAHDELGADTFRMGVEWSRIFPNSTASVDVSDEGGVVSAADLAALDALANQDEVAHYAAVFASLRAHGLDPFVTLNHFTLPTWLHDYPSSRLIETLGGTQTEGGGWTSDSIIPEFEKFAAYMAYKYGDQVDLWATENEPLMVLTQYVTPIPVVSNVNGPLLPRADLAAKALLNQAVAHAAAYKVIHQFDDATTAVGEKATEVGFTISMVDWQAGDPTNPVDVQATHAYDHFYNHWFPDAVIKGEVDANFDGVITADEVHPEMMNMTDYIGVQYYGTGIINGFGFSPYPALPVISGFTQPGYLLTILTGLCPVDECSASGVPVKPSGLRRMLDIANSYGKSLWVTENGFNTTVEDQRTSYLVRHLAVVQQAIADGMPIQGYLHWSNVDNLEWNLGYHAHYGLYHFDPVTLERIPTATVPIFKQIATGNGITSALWQQYT